MTLDDLFARPKLGVCTWTFGNRPLVDVAQRLRALDYDGVELLGALDRYTAREARDILAAHDLRVFALTPDRADLAHPDAATRRAGIDYYKRLLDFAAELGQPLVAVRGSGERASAVGSQVEEVDWLTTAVAEIATFAQARGLRLVVEVRNRYESHLVNTAVQARQLLADVGADNLGVLLSAFHMNIEEPDAPRAIGEAGDRLWLFHMADSNRQGIGRGHLKLGAHLWALEQIGYAGPLIMECVPPGPDLFAPHFDADSLAQLETHLRESRSWF